MFLFLHVTETCISVVTLSPGNIINNSTKHYGVHASLFTTKKSLLFEQVQMKAFTLISDILEQWATGGFVDPWDGKIAGHFQHVFMTE